MKNTIIGPILGLAAVVASIAWAGATNDPGPDPSPDGRQGEIVRYEIIAVDGKLLRLADQEERLTPGDTAESGHRLRTGWFSSAELEAPEYASRFRLGSRTRVLLAHDAPGVLLEVEKGRLRGLFEALTEGDPRERKVRTPSAILAVRGTEYGLHVDRRGNSTLVVFEGTVEVRDRAWEHERVRVRAGHALRIRRGQAPGTPHRHGMTPQGWDQGGMPRMPAHPGSGPGPGSPPAHHDPPSRGHGG